MKMNLLLSLSLLLLQEANPQSWEIKNYPYAGSLYGIDVNVSDPNFVFVVGPGGVYKSSEAGSNWIKTSSTYCEFITISQLNSSYIITNKERSSDGGISWESISVPTPVTDVQFKPMSNQTIYHGGGYKLNKSTDFGSTWNVIDDSTWPFEYKSILLSKSNPELIYTVSGNGYLNKSTNAGQTWIRKKAFNYLGVSVIGAIDPNNSSVIYIVARDSIYKTTNAGSSFVKYKIPYNNFSKLIVDKNSNNTLYAVISLAAAGNRKGVYKSVDGGQNWNFIFGNYLSCTDIYMTTDSKIYLTTNNSGILSSSNGGVFWKSIGVQALSPIRSHFINNQIYFVWDYYSLYKTTNSGNDWTIIHGDQVGKKNSFEAGYQNFDKLFVCMDDSLSLSTNGGQSWKNKKVATSNNLYNLYLSKADENLIYVSSQTSLSRSTDGGTSWSLLNPPSVDGKFLTYPNNSNNIFYIKPNFLYRSSDKGISWIQVQIPLGTNERINELSVGSNIGKLYISAGSIFESDNIGLTWNKIYDWTSLNRNFFDEIKIDPLNENYLFSLSSNKIYGSSNGGIDWLDAGSNLPSSVTSIVPVFAYSNKLHLFTNIGHIVGNPVLTNIETSDFNLTDFSLLQNYPNPFNSSSVIKYSIPKSAQVALKIFNTLGEELETLVNEEKSTGTYEITWHVANLPSGVYFYQLRAGDFVKTKKMILLK